jgi:hypothetical protein
MSGTPSESGLVNVNFFGWLDIYTVEQESIIHPF